MRHREITLRPLEAEERRALLDAHAAALPAHRATAVLAATVRAIGAIHPVTADDVRALPIGDRDQLLLHARRALRGDRLPCTFACRADGCGELLELDLDLAELLASLPGGAAPAAAEGVTDDGRRVRVRAATGADQEHAAQLALADPVAAAEALLVACLLDLQPEGATAAVGPGTAETGDQPGEGETRSARPSAPLDEDGRALAQRLLAELDPAAEILLGGPCPGCGAEVAATLDPITHVWAELEQDGATLEHEIHVLALHYHWSEAEIVGLAPARRARYLARLDRELAAR